MGEAERHGGRSGGRSCMAFDRETATTRALKALSLILDAWDEGTESGLAPEQMAYAALFAALTDLVSLYGEDAVVKLARGLERRVELGEFSLVAHEPVGASSARQGALCRPSRRTSITPKPRSKRPAI